MSRTVELAAGRFAHASGALWLPEVSVAVMADVHLGYGWAMRRHGQLGPVGDGGVRMKLLQTVAELRPESVVFLGDLVHAPRPAPEERRMVESTLRALDARLTVVLGNHDRGFVRDFAGLEVEVCRVWSGAGLVAVHGDRALPEAPHVIAGHLHPAISVLDDAGASHRMPVFVAGRRITLLPAFSPLAAGFDIRAGLPFSMGEASVVAVSGKRAVELGPLSRLQTI